MTITYSDPNGSSDLDHVDLLLDHPQDETIHLRKSINEGERVESGKKYLASFNANAQDSGSEQKTIEWTFTFKNDKTTDWGIVEDRKEGVLFRAKATDNGGQTAAAESGIRASYRNYGTTVLTHGLQNVVSTSGDPPSDKLSRWLRDAACFIRQQAGRGKILVYDHRDGKHEPKGVGCINSPCRLRSRR